METHITDKQFVIVIGRQYGSGGRRIGKKIAEMLGVPYYDKTLLSQAAERHGYNAEIFLRKDERRPSIIRSLLSFTYGASIAGAPDSTLSDEKIYESQSTVIRDLCNEGSCVVVGRTSDYIMRDHPGLLSIFLHAPIGVRARHLIERGEFDNEEDARQHALKTDREREEYYNYYTNRSWGESSNYHISIDSSKFDDAAILAIVRNFVENL